MQSIGKDVAATSLRVYFFSAVALPSVPTLAYLRRKRSTRPAVSISCCLPVKNGWQMEQISTWMSPLWVERVGKMLLHAQCALISWYAGLMAAFMGSPKLYAEPFDYKREVQHSANIQLTSFCGF